MPGVLTNTAVLTFVMGNQGGTLSQVARDLNVSVEDIVNADYEKMGELCRKAQAYYWHQHEGHLDKLLFKHLKICVEALKLDYNGHDTPPWLDRADGVVKIVSEYISVPITPSDR